MGKTEMSSVLKNLKFMQRAALREEKTKEKEEEPKPNGNFTPPSNVIKKCMVILEGDPQPGTVNGRMSFQNFNPSIDRKLLMVMLEKHQPQLCFRLEGVMKGKLGHQSELIWIWKTMILIENLKGSKRRRPLRLAIRRSTRRTTKVSVRS